MTQPFEFYCHSDGRYTVKVCGWTLDKHVANGVYVAVKFRSRSAAEKAAQAKLAANRAFAGVGQ